MKAAMSKYQGQLVRAKTADEINSVYAAIANDENLTIFEKRELEEWDLS